MGGELISGLLYRYIGGADQQSRSYIRQMHKRCMDIPLFRAYKWHNFPFIQRFRLSRIVVAESVDFLENMRIGKIDDFRRLTVKRLQSMDANKFK